MSEMIRHELEFHKTHRYFIYDLYETNELSRSILELVPFKNGAFFTYLPRDAELDKIYNFCSGGIVRYEPEWYAQYLHSLITGENDEITYIFDSYNDDCEDINNENTLFSYGYCFGKEVYYIPRQQSTSEPTLLMCLYRSNVIWHSLCVLSELNKNHLRSHHLSSEVIQEICMKIKLIMILAYDGEGYIFWKKNEMA